jgi:hypothetical protein
VRTASVDARPRRRARHRRAARPARCSPTSSLKGDLPLALDDDTWLRPQGWLVSQALSALAYSTLETYPPLVHEAARWLAQVSGS